MSSENFVKCGIEGIDEVVKGLPKGGIIVVSGVPGSGKTAFAASLIYHGITKCNEPGVYASLIEDDERFYIYMKEFGYDFKKLKNEDKFRYIALPTLLEAGISSSVGIISDVVRAIRAKRLVIDSYTALSQMFKSDAEGRAFLHTIFSSIMRQLECTTVLIKEERVPGKKSEYDYIDFIADGAIHLESEIIEDKLLRKLTIIKMRGTELRNPTICYTLHSGFNPLPPTKLPTKESARKVKYPQDPPGRYSTGIPELDREIGGYPDKSAILFEIDPKLTFREYSLIATPFAASSVLKGRPLIIIPSGGVSWDMLKELAITFGVEESRFLQYVNIVVELGRREKIASNIIKLSIDETFAKKFLETGALLSKRFGAPLLTIIGIDRLAQLFGEKALELIYNIMDDLKTRPGVIMWLLKPTKPWLTTSITPLADLYFKITRRHGTILMYGIKPRTPLYAVQTTEESLIPKIIPIT